jgi:hypothetical protein
MRPFPRLADEQNSCAIWCGYFLTSPELWSPPVREGTLALRHAGIHWLFNEYLSPASAHSASQIE